ncbi:MAG TPA: glycoside hydrolase family 3 N-terminal domain-containing protein [Baekduia sp.]|nr:glycoside hydrolase family 3 N-terminal domain-containing protein [Baekduia sp.]
MTLRVAMIALVALAFVAGACADSDDAGGDSETTRPASPAAPKLTLEQQIGQHFVFPFSGTSPPRALLRRIERGEAAGVILFGRNVKSPAHLRRMTARLQQIGQPQGLDLPLLVMIDQEGGLVKRLPGPPTRSASEMGASAGAQGAATARSLRRVGVNVNLAPVVDVARAGSAMARERRAFGENAVTVSTRAGAFATALAADGVAPALKHFPGFGAAVENTDQAPVRIGLSLQELRTVDLIPFERIDAPVVLLSSAVYPRVDPLPAAFSRRWIGNELRGRIGFDGVAMTDDLQTPAFAGLGTPVRLAGRAIAAGADIALFAQSYAEAERAAAGLAREVREGRLSRAALRDGVRRVLELRRRLGDPNQKVG